MGDNNSSSSNDDDGDDIMNDGGSSNIANSDRIGSSGGGIGGGGDGRASGASIAAIDRLLDASSCNGKGVRVSWKHAAAPTSRVRTACRPCAPNQLLALDTILGDVLRVRLYALARVECCLARCIGGHVSNFVYTETHDGWELFVESSQVKLLARETLGCFFQVSYIETRDFVGY